MGVGMWAAAAAMDLQYLVYTSTINVVFADEEIHQGDESLPYADLARHTDQYSITKTLAEQRVLAANGCPRASTRPCMKCCRWSG